MADENEAEELKPYTVELGGIPHTLKLHDKDAAAYRKAEAKIEPKAGAKKRGAANKAKAAPANKAADTAPAGTNTAPTA